MLMVAELAFPLFSSQKMNTLAVLNDFLTSTLASSAGIQPNAAEIYAEVRGNYIQSSLSSLALATVNTTRRASTTPYDKGSNGIGMYTNSLEFISLAEYENICRLFARPTWTTMYSKTTGPALGVFKKTLADLNTFIKSNMGTDLFLAFDVIECVSPSIQRVKMATGEGGELTEALRPIRETATGAFSFIIEDIKRQGAAIVVLPMDYTVAEITTETMSRLQRMASYPSSISGLLVSLGEGNWKRPYNPGAPPTAFDVGADGTRMHSNFCLDVIDALITELEGKAHALIRKKAAVAVLMVNNVAFVESTIRRSELQKVMGETARTRVERWRKDAVKSYIDGWKECAAFLMDVTYTKQSSKHQGLSGKEKDGVKEKFKVSQRISSL